MRVFLVMSVGLAASAAFGQTLEDAHLNFVPRTPAEAAQVAEATHLTTDFSQAQPFEDRPAGAATVEATGGPDAFSFPSGNMDVDKQLDFRVGNGIFRKIWVPAPSSMPASDGLGPLYNARSCQICHIRDGRGHPPDGSDDTATSMFLRLSVPGAEKDRHDIEGYLHTLPEPTYGAQLQDFGVPGHPPEGWFTVSYDEIEVPLSGGEVAVLRAPRYEVTGLGYGPLHPDTMISPRVAPQMIGLGLLEAIPAAEILALADPTDRDGDGVSGRANIVWSEEFSRPMLGRFGLKAGMPTIREQTGAAFSDDIGISSPIFPSPWGECTTNQKACRAAPHGDLDKREYEIGPVGLDLVTFYSRNLGVPARRDVSDPQVLHGKEVFYQTGCVACHRPSHVTHRLADQPEQSFQLIWPYTDMLLHDMGPGLADHRPEARATGQEWRTPPLWGIGLTAQVSGHTQFLHDGRARSLLEAILWHGGEAQSHREKVVAMPPEDRAALIRFLESL